MVKKRERNATRKFAMACNVDEEKMRAVRGRGRGGEGVGLRRWIPPFWRVRHGSGREIRNWLADLSPSFQMTQFSWIPHVELDSLPPSCQLNVTDPITIHIL